MIICHHRHLHYHRHYHCHHYHHHHHHHCHYYHKSFLARLSSISSIVGGIVVPSSITILSTRTLICISTLFTLICISTFFTLICISTFFYLDLYLYNFLFEFPQTWRFSPLAAFLNFIISSSSSPKVCSAGRMRLLQVYFLLTSLIAFVQGGSSNYFIALAFKISAPLTGCFLKTCTMRLQCVSKILTPRRMLQKTWLKV